MHLYLQVDRCSTLRDGENLVSANPSVYRQRGWRRSPANGAAKHSGRRHHRASSDAAHPRAKPPQRRHVQQPVSTARSAVLPASPDRQLQVRAVHCHRAGVREAMSAWTCLEPTGSDLRPIRSRRNCVPLMDAEMTSNTNSCTYRIRRPNNGAANSGPEIFRFSCVFTKFVYYKRRKQEKEKLFITSNSRA